VTAIEDEERTVSVIHLCVQRVPPKASWHRGHLILRVVIVVYVFLILDVLVIVVIIIFVVVALVQIVVVEAEVWLVSVVVTAHDRPCHIV